MTVEHILVHVEPGMACEARLKYAIAMARHFGSYLTGLTVTVPPSQIPAAMIGDARLLNAAVEAAEESAAFARNQFDALMNSAEIATHWRNGDGNPVEVVSAEAGRADIVILGSRNHRENDGGFYELDPADVVMVCGRPIIVLPERANGRFRMNRILLAWKNTREAARAVHDALPYLKRADAVMLTEVTSTSENRRYGIPISDMADYLRAQGVNLTVHQLRDATKATGDLLVDFAADREADLIVAGAYGHSRLREWAFGGVTATLLQRSPIPCLLSR